ncbi:unnamed protein product [Rhizoctonia solani]|uniref:Uncharacterized protein n=1 Tax=Rhizoctonia solani TaxID=456999 RepID=A0A8H3HGD5_9AGAM|nr:unnamed protein product [Rhizoctonia solani]
MTKYRMGNIWAISYDKSVYHEPGCFNPDRSLDPRGPAAPSFGFGRRSRPGVHLAESTLFITITSLLALFNIRPPKDEHGDDIITEIKMKTNALVSYPAGRQVSDYSEV